MLNILKIGYVIVDNNQHGGIHEYVALDIHDQLIVEQTYRTMYDLRKDVKLAGKARGIKYIEHRE